MQPELIADCVHCGFCLPTCPTYTLWHGKTKLEDPNQTLGSIVPGHERELKLKLSQHLTQG